MSELEIETPDVEVADVQVEAKPDVDLSAVPEKIRGHVDTEKYSSDENYKRAADHGWTPLEVWKQGGKDEADWVNYKAFNKTFDDMQYRREMREEMRATKKAADALLNTFEQDKQRAIQQALAAREAELKVAIADGDAAKAVELQAEIIQAKQQIPAKPQAQTIHPVIADFIDNNPIMNPESPDFNKAYSEQIWDAGVQMGNQLRQQYGRDLSHFEVEACLQRAMKMNKAPQKQVAQKAPAVNSPTQKPSSATPKLSPTAKAIYNKLLASKDGEAKAKAFLANL
jgi:hypothetical protein